MLMVFKVAAEYCTHSSPLLNQIVMTGNNKKGEKIKEKTPLPHFYTFIEGEMTVWREKVTCYKTSTDNIHVCDQ